MIVLPVKIDDKLADLTKRCDGGEPPADAALRTSLGKDLPLKVEKAVFESCTRFQAFLSNVRTVGKIEGHANERPGRPGPNEAGFGARAKGQLQRIHQKRLARSRLAGEGRETGSERNIASLDDGQVLDAQLDDHLF